MTKREVEVEVVEVEVRDEQEEISRVSGFVELKRHLFVAGYYYLNDHILFLFPLRSSPSCLKKKERGELEEDT